MKFKPRFLRPLNERAKPAAVIDTRTDEDKTADAAAERLAALDAAADTVIAEVTTPTGRAPKGKGRKSKVPEGTA
jgi:hypothetical protein